MARIGINGFGRIGRYLVRLMAERNEFPVAVSYTHLTLPTILLV